MRRIHLLLSCFALAVMLPLRAETYEDITIRSEPFSTGSSSHGYLIHRLVVQNLSPSKPHAVRITLPADSYPMGNTSLTSVSRQAIIPPSTTVVMTLPQPPVLLGGGAEARVSIDGKSQLDTVNVGAINHGQEYRSAVTRLLVSRAVSDTDINDGFRKYLERSAYRDVMAARAQDAAARSSSSTTTTASMTVVGTDGSMTTVAPPAASATDTSAVTIPEQRPGELIEIIRAERPPAEWNLQWLDFSRFDSVVMSETELAALPGPTHEALQRWIWGGGTVTLVNPTGDQCEHVSDRVTFCNDGFGVHLAISGTFSELQDEDIKALLDEWRITATPWTMTLDRNQATVTPTKGVPIGMMFGTLFAFAFIAGPFALARLAKRNQRVLILIVVPALALLTSGVMVVYGFLHEGLLRARRTEALTLLDQRTTRAATIGWTGFYTTVSPTGGLLFDEQTELAPAADNELDNQLELNWDDGQRLTSGWIRSRVSTHLRFRRCEGRRERLQLVTRPDGSKHVINGLGAPMESLQIEDAKGKRWNAAHVAAGADAALTAAPPSAPVGTTLREIYTTSWTEISHRPMTQMLKPSTYVAVLEGAPFAEAGLQGANRTVTRNTVFGWMRGEDEH